MVKFECTCYHSIQGVLMEDDEFTSPSSRRMAHTTKIKYYNMPFDYKKFTKSTILYNNDRTKICKNFISVLLYTEAIALLFYDIESTTLNRTIYDTIINFYVRTSLNYIILISFCVEQFVLLCITLV